MEAISKIRDYLNEMDIVWDFVIYVNTKFSVEDFEMEPVVFGRI